MTGGKPLESNRADIIQIKDEYYIRAASSLADDRVQVLKHAELFAVFNRFGDIQPMGRGEQGVFFEGTRHLSRFELNLKSAPPVLLDSEVKKDNVTLTVDLTNPDFLDGDEVIMPADRIHFFRSILLWNSVCYQRLCIKSYDAKMHSLHLSFQFEADFRDIFEVRGMKRKKRGRILKSEISARAFSRSGFFVR